MTVDYINMDKAEKQVRAKDQLDKYFNDGKYIKAGDYKPIYNNGISTIHRIRINNM